MTTKKNRFPAFNRPLTPPLMQTTVFQFDSIAQLQAVSRQAEDGHIYARWGHPNSDQLAADVAALERAEAGLCFASGMAALSCAFISLCRPGDHVAAVGPLYGGSQQLLAEILAPWGIEISLVSDSKAAAAAIRPQTKVLFGETISNPLMDVLPLEALAELARGHNLFFLVDNTFASPVLCQPLRWGAHGVMHSATKYLNGHSDASGGVLAGSSSWIETLKKAGAQLGAVLDPFAAWLIRRGMETLELRMEAVTSRARDVVKFLRAHPRVSQVYYGDLAQNHSARRYLPAGAGGMVSFVVEGDPDRVIRGFEHIVFAPSLAHTSTTVSHPASTSHGGLSEEQRHALGVPWEMLRLSCGIEASAVIMADLEKGLAEL